MTQNPYCEICKRRCGLPSHAQRSVQEQGREAAKRETQRVFETPSKTPDRSWQGSRRGRARRA